MHVKSHLPYRHFKVRIPDSFLIESASPNQKFNQRCGLREYQSKVENDIVPSQIE